MSNPYFKKCPECRGRGVIDHVNLTRPGPALLTVPCRECRQLHVVAATDEELAKPTPGPATAAMLEWAKDYEAFFSRPGSLATQTKSREILQAFIDEHKPAGALGCPR